MDRWMLYSMLKGYKLTESNILAIEIMDIKELREGIIEYLLQMMRTKSVEDNLQVLGDL